MNGELSKREWLTGAEFTAADIQMSFPLVSAGLVQSRLCVCTCLSGMRDSRSPCTAGDGCQQG